MSMSEVDMLRGVAALMKDQHGPDHERHEMWAAMAALLERFAETAAAEHGNWLSGHDAAVVLHETVGYPEALAVVAAYPGVVRPEPTDEPEDLPLATAGEPVHKASDEPGPIRSVCGQDGFNLAEQWESVTCRACRGTIWR